jgi:hypothetical protein
VSELPKPWQIEEALLKVREVFQAIPEEPGSDSDRALQLLEKAGTDLHKVVQAICLAAVEASHGAEAIEAHMRNLAERRDRYWKRAESYRRTAQGIIEMLPDLFPDSKYKGDLLTAYITAGKPGVQIIDETKLEDRFVRIKREPNKAAIAEAILQDGEIVESAVMKNPMPYLVIRVK